MAPSVDLARLQAKVAQLNPVHLAIGFGVVSLFVMIIGTCSAYSDSEALPPPRPAPPPPEKELVTNYRFKETFFHAVIDEDSTKLKIPKISLDDLRRGNAHRVEFSGSQQLRAGRSLTTRSLLIKALKQRLWIGEEGHSLRAPHLVLRISNKTDTYLAYRVETSAKGQCNGKGELPHNSIALAPKQSVERTECLLRSSQIRVEQVEVLELSPLGYHYVSRLDPERLQYDARTSAGHDYGGQTPCRMIPWRRIRTALAQDEAHWYDIIDFYARHNCDEYTFHPGYRWSAEGPKTLPVAPPGDHNKP